MPKPRVYADANLFVKVLNKEVNHEICFAVLEAAERKDIQLVASRLLPVEIRARSGDVKGRKYADDIVHRFLDTAGVEWVEVDVMVSREARRLGWGWNLKAADAIHLATAVWRKADHLMTFDTHFPLGKTVEGVQVSKPRIVWAPTLTDGEKTAP